MRSVIVAPNSCQYDVGDILTTMNTTVPSERWPGTSWVQITDCMLRAADSTHPAGSTGGAWEVTQTVEQMPRHKHYYASYQIGYPYSHTGDSEYITPVGRLPYSSSVDSRTGSSDAGSGQPMPIVNKYIACYMWQRTA